jgi:hypothetical protein
MRRSIVINPGYVFRVQLAIVAFLLLMSLLVYADGVGNLSLFGKVVSLFDRLFAFSVGREESIPTVWSSFNLLFASFLCLVCGYFGAPNRRMSRYWFLLSLAMLAMSVDELVSIHEGLGSLLQLTGLEIPYLKHNAAAVPAALLAALLGLFFVPFLLALPRPTLIGVISSGAIFVLGASGMEAVGGFMLTSGFSRQDFIYDVRRLFEEGLEMFGIVLFVYVLLRHLAAYAPHIGIAFRPAADPDLHRDS